MMLIRQGKTLNQYYAHEVEMSPATSQINKKVREQKYKTEHIRAGDVRITKDERKRLLKLRRAKKRHESGPFKVIARRTENLRRCVWLRCLDQGEVES